MVKLKHYQWDQIERWFCPEPGYVLDFSNKTFSQFFEDHFELNINAEAFSSFGTSKYNRLRGFISSSPPHVVIELLNLLWRRRNIERDDELDAVVRAAASDAWSTSFEYAEALHESVETEDEPFHKLMEELASLPSHLATSHLSATITEWTLDTFDQELRRASETVERDPEAAITAASSMLESVCRSILVARGIDLPKLMDIKTLYGAVREPLGLSPKKTGVDSVIEADVRSTLSALSNAVQSIGALRSHAGTAHGRERGFRRVDPRIARLSVGCASVISAFLIETWEKKFPDDRLVISRGDTRPHDSQNP